MAETATIELQEPVTNYRDFRDSGHTWIGRLAVRDEGAGSATVVSFVEGGPDGALDYDSTAASVSVKPGGSLDLLRDNRWARAVIAEALDAL